MLQSTTNYECYKGLYSSHNDHNFFEIAYSLNRMFGENGIYYGFLLYNFADNHDVDRVASILQNERHHPLFALLYAMPGIPSIYYGSEWGLHGEKKGSNNSALRPKIRLKTAEQQAPHPDLVHAIQKFAKVRQQHPALRYGDYQEVLVKHEQLVFLEKQQKKIS